LVVVPAGGFEDQALYGVEAGLSGGAIVRKNRRKK
jgi:hypothetical protein